MGLGVPPQDLDSMLQQLQQMAPGDLQALLADETEQTDAIPDEHYVKYLDACVKESYDANKDRRERDDLLWKAHESDMPELADKEEWQSKIVLNKPFTTVIQAKSLVRRGLMERPEYFGLQPTDEQNEQYKMMATFWEKGLRYWANTRDAYVPSVFADAAEMGFTVGRSMATKILWEPDANGVYRLRLYNVPPWQIYDDPDRQPRQLWSGLYNVHEEYVDYHVLKEKEKQGEYQNIDQVKMGRSSKDGEGYRKDDQEEERRRKNQTFARNPYRKAVLVREFWGTILNEDGDIVMENGTFTVANGVVIRAARPNPYRRLRWPWVDFSPMPHVLNFHGYGIYESAMALWKFQNNLLNLYIDNENWRINNMYELDPSKMDDPSDLEGYPGKFWMRKRNAPEGPMVTPVLKGDSALADVEFMWGMITNLWENGCFVTELLKGEQGQRKDITATEIKLKLQQSIGVFDSIGKDVERGGEDLLWAMKEVLTTFWDDFDRPSIRDVFGDDPVYLAMLQMGELHPDVRMEALDLDCEVRVKGVSRLFDRQDFLEKVQTLVGMGSLLPQAAMYLKPYTILRRVSEELNQPDFVMSEEEKQQMEMAQQQQAIDQAVQAGLSAADAHVDKTADRDAKRRPAPQAAGGTPASAGAPPPDGPPPPPSAMGLASGGP